MYIITVRDKHRKLFCIQQQESIKLQYTNIPVGHHYLMKWNDLFFENVNSSLSDLMKIGEHYELEGKLDNILVCSIRAKLKECVMSTGNIFVPQGNTILLMNVTFELIDVTIEEQDDYLKAYARAMAIIKR